MIYEHQYLPFSSEGFIFTKLCMKFREKNVLVKISELIVFSCIRLKAILQLIKSMLIKILLANKVVWNGSRNARRGLCKSRISNHKLETEQGRYKNTSADKRTCKLCNNGVEDEIHFPLKCSVLEKIRENILSLIYKLFTDTKNLSDTDKFIWLMTTEDPDMLHLFHQLL